MYIKISVNNKIATLQDNVLIINGNSDYVIKFDFDAEWDAYETKTARFVTARGYTDVVFSGDEVALPVITDAMSVRVGVYAGNLHTTTPAVIFCRRCITDGSGSPADPAPDVYAQIMERLNNLDGVNPATTDKLGVVKIGDNLKITKDGVLSVDTAEAVEQENTKPVTSATVYTAKSNIEALLGNLSDLDTEAKNNLVAAINEAAQTGGGGGASIALDTTLTQSGKAADAKAVGDALAGKQDTISDLETIRLGAAKGATALQSVPSTYRTASEQDTIDDGKVDKVTGKGLSSNDYTDAAKAKVDALAPVATSGSYSDLTDKPTIPTTLPNPNALTFTGAVTGSYDGSAPVTVNIPEGGGGTGGGSSGTWELIGEATSDGTGNSSGIYVPIDFTQYKEVFIEAWIAADVINRVMISSNTAWYDGKVLNTNSTANNDFSSTLSPRTENVLAQTIIHNICGELKPFSSWCSGYAGGGKSVLQVSNARETYLATSYSYIRLDTNNNDAVAEGNWLKVWGRK